MRKYLKDKSIPDLLNSEGDILAIYKEEEAGSPRLMLRLNDSKGRVFAKYRKEKLVTYLEGKALIQEVIDSAGSDYLIYETVEKIYMKVPKAVFDFNLIMFAEMPYSQIQDGYKPSLIRELIKKVEAM